MKKPLTQVGGFFGLRIYNMKIATAVVAFFFVAAIILGTATNEFVVPAEMAVSWFLGSMGISLLFVFSKSSLKHIGSSWLMGVVLALGLFSVVGGIGWAAEHVFLR